MGRSLFDQETQVHNSGTYTDSTAPTEAAFETNPTELETDLNNIRSMLHELRDVRNSNWWSALTAPTTFTGDSPSTRGIQDVAEDLWDLERKRILRRREVVGADITVPSAVAATGSIDCDSVGTGVLPADTETFIFNDGVNPAVTFEFDTNASVSETATLRQVDISAAADDDDVRDAIISAVTGAPTLNISASNGGSGIVTLTNSIKGTAGNISIIETVTDANVVFSGMTGGAGDVVILDTGELPGNTTAAVGAVTTLGTVVAYESSFGTASLEEVAGGGALTPKTLCKIADGASGEPILDGNGNEIHALIQSESNTDGHTISNTTPNRVQLSFVVHNATNDDLELVDGTYIGGETIDYAPAERYALEDIPEYAWLGSDFVDAGAAATTRQAVYDNQGITPVDQTTNSTLDLESAGIYWRVRDDAEAEIFKITEGSSGGTTQIDITSDVDAYVNDALDVDFDQGVSINTGGTRPIDIGETDGVIESTAGDLEIQATTELILSDGNESVGWSRNGILLSDTSTEWDNFETEFGEVSLLNAIVQAKQDMERATAWANVSSADISANTNVTGAGGSPNISAQMPSYNGLTFVSDVDVYVNGQKQRPGADAAANNDVYPGDSAANGDLKFEFDLKYRGGTNPDNINVVVWGQAS